MPPRVEPNGRFQARAALIIAQSTVREALRMRLTLLLTLATGLLLAGVRWVRELNFGAAELRFLLDLSFGAIGLGATLLAAAGTVHLFFGDLDRRGLHFVLSRPVGRGTYLLGRFGGVCVLLATSCAALTLVAGLMAAWRAHALGLPAPWAEVLRGGLLIGGRSALVASMTLVACSLANSALFAGGVAAMMVLIGHLRPLADSAWLRLWPNLQLLEPTAAPAGGSWLLAAYVVGYLGLFVGAAVSLFRRREI